MPFVTPLIDAATIANRIGAMAVDIGGEYTDRPLTLLCCLKGGAFFTADLSRALEVPHRLAYVRAASYGHRTVSSGEVAVSPLDERELDDRDILVVEDIIDTGKTVAALMERLSHLPLRSLKLCALLDKPSRRQVAVTTDYVGFTIDDHFVVGYGLDLADEYRHLPYIGLVDHDEPIR